MTLNGVDMASGFHEPSPIKALRAHQFFVSRGPARGFTPDSFDPRCKL